jgi:uncharacterized repeat protein (TIGR01451 family)
MKTSRALFSWIVFLALALSAFGTVPVAQAQTSSQQQQTPAGLQDAFLQASSSPFSVQGGTYSADFNGLGYQLNVQGLQAEGSGLSWGISLRGMGRGNQVNDVSAPDVMQTDSRLEYQRGNLTEWYRNTAIGVEQGFTINEAPNGNGGLVLHLDLSTNVEGKLNKDGRGISFVGADGKTLRYDQLKAYDANGAELDARMILNPAQVVIQVDDRNAVYPITIDPLIYLEAHLIAADAAANDQFGSAVAVSGNTAVVGAYSKTVGANTLQGAAYVFVQNGTAWIQQAELTASDAGAMSAFGSSVAISGDTIMVGAFIKTIGNNIYQGAVYVFTRSGSIWTQQQELTASDGASNNGFGIKVAMDGNTTVIGAALGNGGKGAAYVFVRNGATWGEQQILTASDGAVDDGFSSSLAISGDSVIIGARDKNSSQGAAYVFTRSGTTWGQQQKLTASDGATNDNFGGAVAISQDMAMVGASGKAISGKAAQGQVYFFARSGSAWIEDQKITPLDGAAFDAFGVAVALHGNTALMGASNKAVAYGEQGVVYVYTANAISYWSAQKEIAASDGIAGDNFGGSVALDGVAVVGVPDKPLGAMDTAGSVYIYYPYNNDTDLMVNQTVSVPRPVPNQAMFYNVTVTNLGPNAAGGVTVSDKLPSTVSFVSSLATSGIYDPNGGTWSLTSIPAGGTATLILNVTVNGNAGGLTITNTASLVGLDINVFDNVATTSVAVAKERILNGGFNKFSGTSKIPTSWVQKNFAATDGKDTTPANLKEGTASVKISNTTAKIKTLTQTLSTLKGSAGDPFTFSYWVKGSALPAAGLCQAQVIFYNGASVADTKSLKCGLTGTFAYTQKTLSFTAPAAYTKVLITFTYSKASGTVWFDQVSLMK